MRLMHHRTLDTLDAARQAAEAEKRRLEQEAALKAGWPPCNAAACNRLQGSEEQSCLSFSWECCCKALIGSVTCRGRHSHSQHTSLPLPLPTTAGS